MHSSSALQARTSNCQNDARWLRRQSVKSSADTLRRIRPGRIRKAHYYRTQKHHIFESRKQEHNK